MINNNFLQLAPEVLNALAENRPIIVLESTIISHGMPYPANIDLTNSLLEIANDLHVVPAIVCTMHGKIRVGLNQDEIEVLAKGKNVQKVSRRNLAEVLIKKQLGATTVSATMIGANLAGIDVFATGGIGGVHRFFESNFDISADITELGRTPIIVVCAGAKAILDVPKTLEHLETLGVPVFGFKTDKFPLFFSSESDLPVNRIDTIKEIADVYNKTKESSLNSALLIANPIPKKYEIPSEIIDSYIKKANRKAAEDGIRGPHLTPFLLSELVDLTDGRSLTANIHLVKNNVELACKIAKSISNMRSK